MSNTEKKCRFVASKGKWIRFGLWTLVFILFVVWTGSLWWLLPIPFAFDLFISRFIPWSFWKKSKNKTFRVIMDWVDAIVFALVAVYFVFLFFFQNYQIPSPSLEKSLLVGDYLFVSKLSYGPRMPNTPLSFPLAQHTLPIVNSKSYFENPQWPYKRLKGLGEIKRKDIVVFNFPAGDTVALAMQSTDFYSLCYSIARERGLSMDEARRIVRSNPKTFGEIIYRPVDRRENYVKRCIGLPGDSLQIINNQVHINGKVLEDEAGTQYNYFVQTKGSYFSETQFRQWNISKDDRYLLPDQYNQLLGFEPDAQGNKLPVYRFPATKEVIEKIKKNPIVNTVRIEPAKVGPYDLGGPIFTLSDEIDWTRDDFGPLWIPSKGAEIELNPRNVLLYGRAICAYERHKLEERQGRYFIDGKPAERYTFEMDYYWMMGDNRHNSADSRAWGFVPEDHVVGKPMRVWLSLDKDRNWFQGKVRWKRFMKKAV